MGIPQISEEKLAYISDAAVAKLDRFKASFRTFSERPASSSTGEAYAKERARVRLDDLQSVSNKVVSLCELLFGINLCPLFGILRITPYLL